MLNRALIIIVIMGLILFGPYGCNCEGEKTMSNAEIQKITETLIAMEKAALERWGNGDPDGFLEIVAEDYTYFDPSIDKRINNYEGIKEVFDGLRGNVDFERFELIDPRVQVDGNMAVLTFNFKSFGKLEDGTVGDSSHWHTTEVFRKDNEQWKLISTHWSFTKSMLKKLSESGAFTTEGE